MKRIILVLAMALSFAAASLAFAGGAKAAIAAPPTAMQRAAEPLDLTEKVRYVCRRYWRCNRSGHRCHWARRCWWERPIWRPWHRHHRRWRHR